MSSRLVPAIAILLAMPLGCARPAPPAPEPQPDIVLLTPTVDLGRTVRGGLASGIIRIRAGTAGATVTRVIPSCGCTTVEIRLPVELPPMAALDIPVTTDLLRVERGGAPAPGDVGANVVERQVLIESAAHHAVTANVRVEVSDRFVLEPARIDFGSLPPGATGAASVLLAPLEGVPSGAVTGITSSHPGVTAVESAMADGKRRIDVRLTAPRAMGPLQAEVRLVLDDVREPEITLPVRALVEPILAYEPTAIERLGASMARPIVSTISFQRRDGEDLLMRSATTDNHRVRVTFGRQPRGPGALLEVMVPVLAPPAGIRTILVVETNVPGQERIEIPIHVAASPPAGG